MGSSFTVLMLAIVVATTAGTLLLLSICGDPLERDCRAATVTETTHDDKAKPEPKDESTPTGDAQEEQEEQLAEGTESPG